MSQTMINKITALYSHFLGLCTAGQPIILLLIRLWLAMIFWKSGLTKINDWEGTLYLFANEYSVPLLSPFFAAVFATCFELVCPILLSFGLAVRLAALPLIVMTAVINFTYLDATEHYHWALLLASLVVFGAGRFSVDYFIARQLSRRV